jgi:phage gp37-like protein
MSYAQTVYARRDYAGLNDSGMKVAHDRFGNIYVAYNGAVSVGNHDIVVIKYNTALVFQWQKEYISSGNYNDTVAGLVTDKDGNVYVAGTGDG